VGAGPAGTAAAIEAKRRGLSVWLLDKKLFPRDKTCGDGVSSGAGRIMKDMGIPLVSKSLRARAINGVSIQGPAGTERTYISEGTNGLAFTSRRMDLDKALFDKAVEVGAEFAEAAVRKLVRDENNRVVGVAASDGQEYRGKIVVAADGATSVIRRELMGTGERPYATAIAARAYAKLKNDLPSAIYLKYLPNLVPGYLWVFPMTDTEANVGLGAFDNKAFRESGIKLKDVLEEFQQENSIPMEIDMNTYQTWQIPCWTPSMPFSKKGMRIIDGVCLVGDAGGYVDYLTAGGIKYAISTGMSAAQRAEEIIVQGATERQADSGYLDRYRRDVRKSLFVAYLAQEILGKHPTIMNMLLRRIPKGKEGTLLKALVGGHA
jgi:geranylgeranyl reductase family protein